MSQNISEQGPPIRYSGDDVLLRECVEAAEEASPHLKLSAVRRKGDEKVGAQICWKSHGACASLVAEALQDMPEASPWKRVLENWLQNLFSGLHLEPDWPIRTQPPIRKGISATTQAIPTRLFAPELPASEALSQANAHGQEFLQTQFSLTEIGIEAFGAAASESVSAPFENLYFGDAWTSTRLGVFRNELKSFENHLLDAMPKLGAAPGFERINDRWNRHSAALAERSGFTLAVQIPVDADRQNFRRGSELSWARKNRSHEPNLHWESLHERHIDDPDLGNRFSSTLQARQLSAFESTILPSTWPEQEVRMRASRVRGWRRAVEAALSNTEAKPSDVLQMCSQALHGLTRWALFRILAVHLSGEKSSLTWSPLFPALLMRKKQSIQQDIIADAEKWIMDLPVLIHKQSLKPPASKMPQLEKMFLQILAMKSKLEEHLKSDPDQIDRNSPIWITDCPTSLTKACLKVLDHVASLNPLLLLFFSGTLTARAGPDDALIRLGTGVLRTHMTSSLEKIYGDDEHWGQSRCTASVVKPAYDPKNDDRLKKAALAHFDADSFVNDWFHP